MLYCVSARFWQLKLLIWVSYAYDCIFQIYQQVIKGIISQKHHLRNVSAKYNTQVIRYRTFSLIRYTSILQQHEDTNKFELTEIEKTE